MKRLAVLVVFSLILCACRSPTPRSVEVTAEVPEHPVRLFAPQRYRVAYRVSGSAQEASVSFVDAVGDTERLERVRLPWGHSLVVDEESSLHISAQNRGEQGTVTCRIELNGRSLDMSTSSGAHAIASCGGRAGPD